VRSLVIPGSRKCAPRNDGFDIEITKTLAPMEPVVVRRTNLRGCENSFTIFVDRIFTTLFEPLFTNIFDAVAPIAAIACLYRAGNAG
jgi:hypothetical protein